LYWDILASPGAILCCGYAGVVEDVESDVADIKVGDRFAGFVYGGTLLFRLKRYKDTRLE